LEVTDTSHVDPRHPRVAVLLAAWNGARWIDMQVQSILHQNDVSVDLYISVDQCTDDTHAMCIRFADQDSRVRVLPYGNSFSSACANFFRLIRDTQFSEYDYIALADQDDFWRPEKLQRAIQMLLENQASAYSSNVCAFWENGKRKELKKSYPQRRYDHFFESAGPGCTYVLTREACEIVKHTLQTSSPELISKVELHDWFIYAVIRAKHFSWFIDDFVGVDYRQHTSNVFGANSGFRALLMRFKLVNNQWYRKQVLLTVELLSPKYLDLFSSRLSVAKRAFECKRKPLQACALIVLCLLGVY